MLLNGNETTIRPVLAMDFPELRALYEAYYTSSLSGETKEHKKALKSLLSCVLQRTDPALAADPSPLISGPNALDVDEMDEVVFIAGGSRGKVLRLLRDEMVNWMKVALRDTGPDLSSLLPPESEPQSGT